MGYQPYPKQAEDVLIVYPGDLIPIDIAVFNGAICQYAEFNPGWPEFGNFVFQPIKTIYAVSPAFRLAGEGGIEEIISQLFYSPSTGITVLEKRPGYRYFLHESWVYPYGNIPIITPLRYALGYFEIRGFYAGLSENSYDPQSRQFILTGCQDNNLLVACDPVWSTEYCRHDRIDLLIYYWKPQPPPNITTTLSALMIAGLASLPFSIGRKP